jgi:hypothetical protein
MMVCLDEPFIKGLILVFRKNMYTIYLSNKLQQLLSPVGLQSGSDLATSFLGDWNAHLFTVDRRKCLILVNNKT